MLCICRHFTLLHTALSCAPTAFRPASRCGFSNYFDKSKWYDHWITERWDGRRWVREDPQIDELQAERHRHRLRSLRPAPGKFLTGAEAWIAARAGEVDAELFGIFDMWGLKFISGNVITDFAAINKVELLPWDAWGMMPSPYAELSDETMAVVDDSRSSRPATISTPSARGTTTTSGYAFRPTSRASSTTS